MAKAVCSECGCPIEYTKGEDFAYCPICENCQVEIKKVKAIARTIKPDEIDAVELFMKRIKTLADAYDKIPIPEKCFVTSSTKLFEFAKEYLKDTGIKVLFNDSVPTYTSYLMSEKDYKKVGE